MKTVQYTNPDGSMKLFFEDRQPSLAEQALEAFVLGSAGAFGAALGTWMWERIRGVHTEPAPPPEAPENEEVAE